LVGKLQTEVLDGGKSRMKQIAVMVVLLLLLGAVESLSADGFIVDFGNVNQGQSKSITVKFNANTIFFAIVGDTPFEAQVPAPFTVSPATGTVRALINTTLTVTLPGNAAIGVYDKQMKIILHRRNDNPERNFPLKAAVVGFPYTFTPASTLDLGTQSQGTLLVKNNSVSQESFVVTSQNFNNNAIGAVKVAAGGTVQIILSVLESSAGQPDITESVGITDQRSLQTKHIQVTAHPGPAKPDLVATIQAVKIFPRAASETETTLQVTVNVKNAGFVASTPCQAKVSVDTDKVLDLTIDSIAVGAAPQSQTKVFKTTKTGSHTLKFKVDLDDKNNELDESNNLGTMDVQIP
jgi:hypothetical protein